MSFGMAGMATRTAHSMPRTMPSDVSSEAAQILRDRFCTGALILFHLRMPTLRSKSGCQECKIARGAYRWWPRPMSWCKLCHKEGSMDGRMDRWVCASVLKIISHWPTGHQEYPGSGHPSNLPQLSEMMTAGISGNTSSAWQSCSWLAGESHTSFSHVFPVYYIDL
jgi:hypothetical protein